MTKHLPNFERDLIRALQFCYYVHALSIVDDKEYDRLQKEYEERTNDEIPIGSDLSHDYNSHEQRLAFYLIHRMKGGVNI